MPTCLLLGVTPELARVHTPLLAVDRNPRMIEALWPGDDAGRHAVCADWTTLEASIGPIGCAVGDGSLNVMAYPHPQTRVLERLRALIPAHGCVITRCFVRDIHTATDHERETVARVVETAEHSASFHGFKWRLAMAICGERGPSLPVVQLREELRKHFPDRDALARRTGWDPGDIQTIDAYANSTEIYSFPSRAEFVQVARATGWRPHLLEVPGYELAERCPLLVLS